MNWAWAEDNIEKTNTLCYTCLQWVVVAERYVQLICKYVQYSIATTGTSVTSYPLIRVMYGQCFGNAVHVYDYLPHLDLEFLLFCCFLLFCLKLYQNLRILYCKLYCSRIPHRIEYDMPQQIMGRFCSQQLYFYLFL
jgi:hypothetical protein